MNLAKTKVMINDVNRGPTFTSGKHSCGVCCKGVGSDFIFCNHCIHWLHKGCSGLNGKLDNVVDFKCRTCLNPPFANDDEKRFDLAMLSMRLLTIFVTLVIC